MAKETYYRKLLEILKKGRISEVALVRKEFDIITQPALWVFVREIKEINTKFEDIALRLSNHNIPFACIINQEGSYFLDLTPQYNANVDDIYISASYKTADFGVFRFVYNYDIFGLEEIGVNRWATVIEENIWKIVEKLKLDYIINLDGVYVYPYVVLITLKIIPEKFSFKGFYLIHRAYDAGDKITLEFVYRFMKILVKFSNLIKRPFVLFKENGIKTKKELIDEFEGNIMEIYLRELFRVGYNPGLEEEDIEKRIKRIERVLNSLH